MSRTALFACIIFLQRSNKHEMGMLAMRRLQDMVRTGQSVVAFTAVKFRHYVDDAGHAKRERSEFQQSLGSLNGLDLIQSSLFFTIYAAIADVESAHEDADRLGEKPKSVEVDALANRLNEYDRILRDGNRFLDLEQAFFNNNFFLLCFLQGDKTERYKNAGIAMRRSGVEGGKDKAKAWLAEQEKAIKLPKGTWRHVLTAIMTI